MISSSRETCNPGAASARHGRLRGVESRGVDCGVDVTLGDATGQDRGRVQVSKSSGGGGVSQVICGKMVWKMVWKDIIKNENPGF
jgi:hypothetical protein